MNKKRTLLTVVALILVCVLSVMGTLAYLKSTTTTVTNIFVAAGGPGPFVDPDPDDETKQLFALKEYKVDVSASGKYTLKPAAVENETDAITYDKVMPGTTLPKQAFVKLSRTSTTIGEETIAPAPAYLYLEVCGTSPVVKVEEENVAVYTWEIDDANWVELKDAQGNPVPGPNNGKMYLYKLSDGTHVVTDIAAYNDNTINIIKNNKVYVADVELPAGEFKLEFNAFLSQASTGETDDPAAVFTACFG